MNFTKISKDSLISSVTAITSIGRNLLLIVICETARLDIGSLNLMCGDYRANFAKVDQFIDQINKQQL